VKPFRLPAACVVASLAAALAAAPSIAQATIVEAHAPSCEMDDPLNCSEELTVTGQPGETSDLLITREGGYVVVADSRTPLTVENECTLLADGRAQCTLSAANASTTVRVNTGSGNDVVRVTLPDVDQVIAMLEDGDDRLEVQAQDVLADGGPGVDALTVRGRGSSSLRGAAGDDVLTGDAGRDQLEGDDGRDRMSAGAGDDELIDADTGSIDPAVAVVDQLDGGPGTDELSYRYASRGVQVDLRTGAARGEATENDDVTSIEAIRGSGYADRLTAGPDTVRLRGAGGGDVLAGGPATAAFDCGRGRDVAQVAVRTTPLLDRSCERWSLGPDVSFALPQPARGAVRLPARCASRCTLALAVATATGRRLGRTRATLRGTRTLAVPVREPLPRRVRLAVTGAARGGILVALR
jgi:hemolysin type calcium-binding protein